MTNGQECVDVVYNLASARLRTLTDSGLSGVVKKSLASGIDGFSVIPFRAPNIHKDLYRVHVNVVENAWNPTQNSGLMAFVEAATGWYRRKIRHDKYEWPLPQDAIISPNARTSASITRQFLRDHWESLYASYLFPTPTSTELILPRNRVVLHDQQTYRSHNLSLNQIADIVERRRVLGLNYDPKGCPSDQDRVNRLMLLSKKTRVVGVDINWSTSQEANIVKKYLSGQGWLAEMIEFAASIRGLRYLRIETSGTDIKDIIVKTKEIISAKK